MKTYQTPAIKVISCDSPYTDVLNSSGETYAKDPYGWTDQLESTLSENVG